MSLPNRLTSPRVGRSDRNSSRSSEVLPAPEGPVRNWKECAGIRNVRSRKISGPSPYRKPTFSNRTKVSSARHEPWSSSARHQQGPSYARRGPWPETPGFYLKLGPNLRLDLNLGRLAPWPGFQPDKTVLRPLWFPVR